MVQAVNLGSRALDASHTSVRALYWQHFVSFFQLQVRSDINLWD